MSCAATLQGLICDILSHSFADCSCEVEASNPKLYSIASGVRMQ
jgi:hypothetical protein